jgi:threonylcarbamoyladenosine tRNA methylthiotransferase MtaB
LGCKVNQQETEAILGFFRLQGYRVVDFAEMADVYLVNTCTVTHLGDRKSRQIIRRARRRNSEAVVVVTGCYAQRAPEEILEIPGVDLIVGNQEREQIIIEVEKLIFARERFGNPICLVKDIKLARSFEELPLSIERNRTRAFVKVEDGCNQFCSYCIVPYTRGRVRSRSAPGVVEEVARLVAAGYQEVVLTGIHISAYGQEWREAGGESNLATLIRLLLEEVPDLPRLRISSLEPTEIPEELMEIMANSRVLCRHLHIPLQNGDDQILMRMNRPYSTNQYVNLVENLRKQIPGLAVTTDIMVGFPGETEEHFQRSYAFIRDLGFSDLHVFKYSPRKGTPAAEFIEQVLPADKESRSQRLIALAQDLRCKFSTEFEGCTLEVLLEEEVDLPDYAVSKLLDANKHGNHPVNKYWTGYTDNYIRVAIPGSDAPRDLGAGRFIQVMLSAWNPEFSWGRITGI